MSVKIKPTKIRDTTYLLVPKGIAQLADISDKTKFNLSVKQKGQKHILEFSTQ